MLFLFNIIILKTCGGYTYEEAILKAHKLMTKKYGATSEALYDMAIKNQLRKMSKELSK